MIRLKSSSSELVIQLLIKRKATRQLFCVRSIEAPIVNFHFFAFSFDVVFVSFFVCLDISSALRVHMCVCLFFCYLYPNSSCMHCTNDLQNDHPLRILCLAIQWIKKIDVFV